MNCLCNESPVEPLVLSNEEQSILKALAGNTHVAKTISDRCRVILRYADELKAAEVRQKSADPQAWSGDGAAASKGIVSRICWTRA